MNYEHRNEVPPKPLDSYYVQPGEIDAYGKPLAAGSVRHEYWPGFGYEGYCADRAINTDSVAALRWCIDKGIINRDSKTLYNWSIRRLAQERGAKLIAHYLAEQGWPE
jgi:hypothetical protein